MKKILEEHYLLVQALEKSEKQRVLGVSTGIATEF